MKMIFSQGQPLYRKDHLQQLRAALELPPYTLGEEGLVFLMAAERRVMASYTDGGHLSLLCEVGRLDALRASGWRALLLRLSSAHDYDFPISLLTVDGKLALLWCADARMDTAAWLRRAEDALTWSFDIHTRINNHTL
jgi:hypothetical protein